MSVSHIPEGVKCRLWGKAAGLCQYEGCTHPLYLDDVTKCEFNGAYIAHIIADKPGGPRGDPVLSEELKADISNLMLMCDKHHRLIDKVDVAGHSVERLRGMKHQHERWVEIVTPQEHRQSHILLYDANVGEHAANATYEKAKRAMLPNWYPAETEPFAFGMKSSFRDRTQQFWQSEREHLQNLVDGQVRRGLRSGTIAHLSVFAVAPQPLLMLLGYLLSDIPPAEVYQLHREPEDWCWQELPDGQEYAIEGPNDAKGHAVLVLALSAPIGNDRITPALGEDVAIWRVTIPKPDKDFLKSRQQLRDFRETIRPLLDEIMKQHGDRTVLHVFPAVPVAAAVEFGRAISPKAAMSMKIYDQNKDLGGFVHALDLPTAQGAAR